jgi:hypothetical protein
MKKPRRGKHSEKTRLHRSERKRERRKGYKKKLDPKQIERKEWREAAKIVFGQFQLMRLGEPLIEESRQREIEANIVEEG